jgi:hypothetical protein
MPAFTACSFFNSRGLTLGLPAKADGVPPPVRAGDLFGAVNPLVSRGGNVNTAGNDCRDDVVDAEDCGDEGDTPPAAESATATCTE